jgi:hypothetical protein
MGSASGLQQVGDQAGGDRDARRIFLVGPGVGEIRDNGVDFAPRRGGDIR